MLNIHDPSLTKGSLILLTGANGFLGSHIADLLLSLDYKVRGTVRDIEKSAWMQTFFDGRYGSGKFALHATDFLSPASSKSMWDEAVSGVAGIVHTAASLRLGTDPNEVITPELRALGFAVEAASASGTVKKFVLTSSTWAAVTARANEEYVVRSGDYNTDIVKEAWTPPFEGTKQGVAVYGALKTQVEQLFYDLASQPENCGIEFNSVLPDSIFGNPLSPKHQGFPSTSGWLKLFFHSEDRKTADFIVSLIAPQHMVSVKDTARLHAIALLHPEIRNERLFAVSEPYSWETVLQYYRQMFPARKFFEFPGLGTELGVYESRERAAQLLRERFGREHGFEDLAQTLDDALTAITAQKT